MKKAYRITILFLATAMCGCVNFANRVLDNEDIKEVYQATRTAARFSFVLMSPTGGEHFMWENLLTIPVGVIGFADTACEAVIDTVCLPFDCFLAKRREEKR